jgi:hypothetical protein
MANSTHLPLAAYAGIAALVAWRLYTRTRRLVGRQRLTRVRPWISVCFFPLLLLGLLAGTFTHPARALAELAGVVIGVGLALYSLRVTRFETTPEGLFYTPSAHIGILLSLLFIGRLAYRFVQAYTSTAAFTQPSQDLFRSPLTLAILGTLAGYYAAYAFGLLRWRQRVEAAVQPPPT